MRILSMLFVASCVLMNGCVEDDFYYSEVTTQPAGYYSTQTPPAPPMNSGYYSTESPPAPPASNGYYTSQTSPAPSNGGGYYTN